MLQIIAWTEIIAIVPLWWVTLYKLLPLYRAGRVRGGWRVAFQMLCALLAWYTVMAGTVIGGGNTWFGWMVSIPFAVAMLAWLAVAVGTHSGKRRAPAMTQDVPAVPEGVRVRTTPRAAAQPQVVPVEAYSAGADSRTGRGPRASRIMREVEA